MTYLQDRKQGKNKIWIVVLLVLALAILFYFRAGLSNIAVTTFEPLLELGNKISGGGDNGELELAEERARTENYDALLDENLRLKEILDRAPTNKEFVLGAILAKPNQSAYDTLLIDIGLNKNIQLGQLVFALGNIPIGRVAEVFETSSKVMLFSNPGEGTDVVVSGKGIHAEIVGRGGGNFEMILPRDLNIEKNSVVSLPGITPYTVAKVETTISDPRDAFTKILLTTPVNLFELTFVQVAR